MRTRFRSAALAAALALTLPCATVDAQTPATKPAAAKPKDSAAVERGRYLSRIAGCNDCHTPGYLLSAGKVPENLWLTGDTLGWRGPWGTTYAPNLRDKVPKMTEAEWVKYAKTAQFRPPMPWFNLHEMTEVDLKALYRFIVHLGPGGQPAPAYVPPDQEPKPPYVTFPAPPK
ncbi:MAG TPA: cytochrome C [Casimicrobiaceae bacterium]|nr:cytochrome C [Casimicrobiaceae bacterium]